VAAKRMIAGFGLPSQWYVSVWATGTHGWNKQFIQTVGGKAVLARFVGDFFRLDEALAPAPVTKRLKLEGNRATLAQIRQAMERIWEIGAENKKWDASVASRVHSIEKFPRPSSLVLKRWVRLQIADMHRLVGDLGVSSTCSCSWSCSAGGVQH
jgi:hypothetical protein